MKDIVSVFLVTVILVGTLVIAFDVRPVDSLAISNGLVEQSNYPVVYVYPNVTDANVGETFTIAVVGFNFTSQDIPDPDYPILQVALGDLVGWDIEFTWDPTILHYLNHTVTCPAENYPAPNLPSPYGGVLHSPPLPWEGRNIVDENGYMPLATSNETRAWFAYSAFNPAPPQNGNFTFFTMTFKVIAAGESLLRFVNCDLASDFPEYYRIYGIIRDGVCRTHPLPQGSGDVNGDGVVDIYDVVLAIASYGSVQGDLNWNLDVDLAPPYGRIDIFDLVTITFNYGKT